MIPPLAEPEVRPARADEAEALVRLSELAVAELCPRDYPGDVLRAARRVLRVDPALFTQATVLVAEVGSELLGAASWGWSVPDDAIHRGLPRRPQLAYRRLCEFEVALPGCSVPCVQMTRTLPALAPV